jgi:hypothetical protein
MASRAEIDALRQAAMLADTDVGEIVEPDMFTDPAVVADFQPPGKLHHDSGLDRDATADARAEQTEQKHAQAGSWQGGRDQQRLDQKPDRLEPSRPAALETFRGIEIEAHSIRHWPECSGRCQGGPGLAGDRLVDAGQDAIGSRTALEKPPIHHSHQFAVARL